MTNHNKPTGSCAVCLSAFADDVIGSDDFFMRTACYHYFHGMCFGTWWKYEQEKAREAAQDTSLAGFRPRWEQEQEMEKLKNLKPLCPVCRAPIEGDDLKDLSLFLEKAKASRIKEQQKPLKGPMYQLTPELRAMQLRFKELWETQKSKGGLIEAPSATDDTGMTIIRNEIEHALDSTAPHPPPPSHPPSSSLSPIPIPSQRSSPHPATQPHTSTPPTTASGLLPTPSTTTTHPPPIQNHPSTNPPRGRRHHNDYSNSHHQGDIGRSRPHPQQGGASQDSGHVTGHPRSRGRGRGTSHYRAKSYGRGEGENHGDDQSLEAKAYGRGDGKHHRDDQSLEESEHGPSSTYHPSDPIVNSPKSIPDSSTTSQLDSPNPDPISNSNNMYSNPHLGTSNSGARERGRGRGRGMRRGGGGQGGHMWQEKGPGEEGYI
eukprot:CAMPEP_0184651366 /NCGR_PEP_ID=MMETSP0308-20130426/8956_1 /TAXON_ID=38269 /ORGANISM="Gloeochaete witrockiana, Strain SAG 46.84" /LENGTH=430 /DNA_ID=CAMNT_0027085517 /DNA_START=277 /DNA_END=1569 /DNA_ORIENTATION=+